MYTKGLFGTKDIPFSMKNILDTFLCLFVIILDRLPSFPLIQNHRHQCKSVVVLLIYNFHLKNEKKILGTVILCQIDSCPPIDPKYDNRFSGDLPY